MKFRLILLFFATASGIVAAQTLGHSISVLYKVTSDGIWLRWAPTDFTTWQLGNKYGYRIERYTLKTDGTLESKTPVQLSPSGIRPFTIKQLDELSTTVEEARIIQELIYDTEGTARMNGKTPASLLKQHEDMNNRFSMALLVCDLSPKVAEAAGLFWKDVTAAKGSRYIYKILLNENPSKTTVTPAVIVAEVTEPKPLKAFNDVTAVFGDKTVTLTWPVLTHRGVYSAYTIEKSDDGNAFNAVTDLPYIPMTQSGAPEDAHFVDSLAANNKTYYYRVKGITPFGEVGPPSNAVGGTGKDNLSGSVVIYEVMQEDKDKTMLRWMFPKAHEPKIAGFIVSRAPKADGPYIDVTPEPLSPAMRELSDAGLTASAYYRIKVVDAAGNEITHSQPYYVHVEDNTPPAVPQGLAGVAEKSGKVILRWNANTDTDLLGYRVFSSHDLKHEFVEVTPQIITANAYTDTINTSLLNKKIFYKILAVDNNFNTSDFSKPATVDRPDMIAPVASVFNKAEKKDNTISLQWTNSISSDVMHYTLYRSVVNDTTKTKLVSWKATRSQTTYIDDLVLPGKTYQYILNAYDSAGNTATATSKEIKFESGIRKDVTDLKAVIDREKRIITLKWVYDTPAKKCLLYRKKGDEPYTLYQSVDGKLTEFTDKQVFINTTYWYKIQLVMENNARTELSKPLKVPF